MRKLINSLLVLLLLVSSAFATGSTFNATTSKITVTQTAAINGTLFTISCWNIRHTDGEGSVGLLWAKDVQGSIDASNSYSMRARTTGPTMYFQADLATTNLIDSITEPSADVWHYITVYYNTNGSSTMWVDGVTPPAGFSHVAGSGDLATNTNNLIFGNNTGTTQTWDGQIASCCYYDRLLSTAEVNSTMRYGCNAVPGAILDMPMGAFIATNHSSTAVTTSSENLGTIDNTGPPVSAGQGSKWGW